jgi:hypothetical protein
MVEKIVFEGKNYDLDKTTEENAELIRGLSRVIQKVQLELQDCGDKTLAAQTALTVFYKTLREKHLTEEMIEQPEQQ